MPPVDRLRRYVGAGAEVNRAYPVRDPAGIDGYYAAMSQDLSIGSLGHCRFESPLVQRLGSVPESPGFVEPDAAVLLDDRISSLGALERIDEAPRLEVAGPRREIYFEPAATGIGIVTCGGLCPGLNNVIRGITMEAWHGYGVRRIYGFRYGLEGFIESAGHQVLELTPDIVSDIHEHGGSLLGSSRGPQDPRAIVDRLDKLGVQVLFVVGGDGSMRAALSIATEARARDRKLAVVGIPKTIDNDMRYLDKTFGFDTAVGEAVKVIRCAHAEARGAFNGIGLVKLMGRHSGFLACAATLATSHVNFCLIPEMLDNDTLGPAFLDRLKARLEDRRHAVVVIAEGTGQERLADPDVRDASGNVKLVDVGAILAERIKAYFAGKPMEVTLKYIDPSYTVRSVAACPSDSVYCWQLAADAVHAAMSGRTEMIVGRWHGRMVHVPIERAISERNRVDLESPLWLSVLETTGQPTTLR